MPDIESIALATGLPAGLDSEKLCLASAILYPDTLADVVSKLNPDFDFSQESHRRIFMSIRQLYDAGLAVDSVLLCNRLFLNGWLESVGGITGIADLITGTPKIANLEDHISLIKEKSRLRKAILIGQSIVTKALTGVETSEEIISSAIKNFSDEIAQAKIGPQLISEFVDSVGPSILLDPSAVDAGIPTGYIKLDELAGGFHESEIYIVGARPKTGKTICLVNVCQNLARAGKHAVFFSLEMPKRRILERMICGDSGVSLQRFRSGFADADERERLRESMARIYELPISIDDTSGLRVAELGMRLKAIHQKRPVSLCAIDFLQLLRPQSYRGSENEQLTQICNDLQQLAKSTGIPFLIASQLNRDSERRTSKGKKDPRPGLADLRGSGSIEQIGNVIVLLHREWLYDQDKLDLRDRADFIVAKNRDGEEGTIPMGFMGWRFRFENIDSE